MRASEVLLFALLSGAACTKEPDCALPNQDSWVSCGAGCCPPMYTCTADEKCLAPYASVELTGTWTGTATPDDRSSPPAMLTLSVQHDPDAHQLTGSLSCVVFGTTGGPFGVTGTDELATGYNITLDVDDGTATTHCDGNVAEGTRKLFFVCDGKPSNPCLPSTTRFELTREAL